MSGLLEKTYNPELMNEISTQYKSCAELTGNVIKNLDKIKTSFRTITRGSRIIWCPIFAPKQRSI